jgi:hypothetical protein
MLVSATLIARFEASDWASDSHEMWYRIASMPRGRHDAA